MVMYTLFSILFSKFKFIYSLKRHCIWYIRYIKWKYIRVEISSEIKVHRTHGIKRKEIYIYKIHVSLCYRGQTNSYFQNKHIHCQSFLSSNLVQPLLRNKYAVFTMGGTVALRSPSQVSMTGELLTCSQVQTKSVTLHIPILNDEINDFSLQIYG